MSRYGEKCNVTLCSNKHDGISHNFSKLFYCYFCARKINEYNRSEPIFSKEEMQLGKAVRRKRDRNE